jgi:hypothetical protein
MMLFIVVVCYSNISDRFHGWKMSSLLFKDALTLFTCSLPGDPASQVFYLLSNELRFGDIHSHTRYSLIESITRTIFNFCTVFEDATCFYQ